MDRGTDPFRPQCFRRVLDNGLVVLALERKHLPTISVTLLIPTGTAMEPEDRPGVAFFTSLALPMGTQKRSAVEVAEAVDALGGTLATGCDLDYATAEITCLKRNAPELIRILAEVVRTPAFSREDVDRRRAQILGLLERRKNDYGEVVRDLHAKMIFGAHPYHRVREGNPKSVREMTRDDLIAFHADHYIPDGTILALVGDLDSDVAFGWAEECFGGWPVRGRPVPRMPEIERSDRCRVGTIQREVQQAYIRIGNVGFPRNHPDYPSAVVMNYILGGAGFGSRLMHRLREEKGLTYGIASGFRPRREAGGFVVATQTGLETMNEVLRETLGEIARFRAEGVTDEELAWAKRFISGSLPLTMETNDQIAQKLLEQEFYGLAEQFWLDDLEKMQRVTREEVLAVAERQIDETRFSIALLSDFRKVTLAPEFSEANGTGSS